ncbi:MAG: flagellar filament capping protein FliD [Lachnospiraceae bacterium]|nr:flagellar filament capping protein FliD [Lachnospiraceae bacterium]
MPIRLSGLNSGMDTESIITELVSAKKVSVNNVKKEKIKLSWKMDAWKELNSKIYSLYTGTVDKMRWASSYVKKKSTVSDNNLLSVVSGENAINGVQTASVESLAKAGYLTGGKVQTADGGKVAANTKLTDMGIAAGTTFNITSGGKTTEIKIDADTTMNGLVDQLKGAGVNVNFDADNQRLFVSAKATGKDNDFSFSGDDAALKTLGLIEDASNPDGAVKIDGSNAVLYLNGAKFESANNTFQVNGATYTLTGVSEKNADGSLKESTITTTDDYDEIYDTVKNFLKKYNELINEMDKLYNAESASGYDPLLAEEKEALTDTEISDWENKIKGALLRKDSSLSSIMSTLKTTMSGSVEVDGEKMYLADFGIKTLGYFNAEENERNAYHIDGDKDDSNTSMKEDSLKAMIASDPTKVQKFFSQLSQNLYTSMTSAMSRVEGYRSIYKVYNDKQMETELSGYDQKIADMEEALTDYENKWYDKFSAMEVAMAKMSSKQSAISGLFGM